MAQKRSDSALKVAFTIGLMHPRYVQVLPNQPAPGQTGPTYMWTSLGPDLMKASETRGWQAFGVTLGQPQGPSTPRPDLVINLISDALTQQKSVGLLEAFEADHGIPVVNGAPSIKATARHTLPETLRSVDGVRIPKTTLYTRQGENLSEHVADRGHTWPVLLRPVGSHGGAGLVKLGPGEAMPDGPDGPYYFVTDYVDFASEDGLYRKHRAVWTGERLFRRHMIVSDTWKVDGQSRTFMVGKQNLIDEECAFLGGGKDPLDELLSSLFRHTGLDFGLIDFAVMPDGAVLIFELNAAVQVTGSIPEDKRERWGYLEETNEPILQSILNTAHKKYESARQGS